MSLLDTSALLPDISTDHPTGENLELDPDFAELERLAQGKPEQQFGATVVPAEEPEWKAVISSATALMSRTYDLRVMAQLAVARLNRDGIGGFAETLALVREVLRTRWTDVHPLLDAEDDNDPLTRANSLLLLAQPVRVLRVLRTLPLARSARAGSVNWRDISIANGTIEPPADGTPMTSAVVAGIFRDTEPHALETLRADLASAIASVVDIPAAFDDAAGHGNGPDFNDLTRLLRDMQRMVDVNAPATTPAAPVADGAPADTAALATATTVMPLAERAQPVMSIQTMGPPTNRADALRLLDLVAEFYERNEPSSPLPLLIARARRLADMGFMDIMRDLAPDGISQVERIAGTADSS